MSKLTTAEISERDQIVAALSTAAANLQSALNSYSVHLAQAAALAGDICARLNNEGRRHGGEDSGALGIMIAAWEDIDLEPPILTSLLVHAEDLASLPTEPEL